jgi:hypothetical protein
MTTHAPDWTCDRCGHPLKRHGDPKEVDFIKRGTRCIVRGCPCDGWYPAVKK